MIKHISYNPKLELSAPLDLIPEGYVLEKVVAITEYEWVMVVRNEKPTGRYLKTVKIKGKKYSVWDDGGY